jgi:sugar-phosphatase
VVTSAPRRLAEIRIAVAGFPRPKILVAVEDIERGKPDPEGFLKAANELGVAPADCLVFEDTGPGVEAGLHAGMQVVGVLTTVTREQLSTNLVIRDFRDVAISWRLGGFDVSIVSA